MSDGINMARRKITSPDDAEVSKFAETTKARIVVIGVGGSGSNTMSKMSEVHIEGATLVAANTDSPHLETIDAQRKILLGRTVTKGLGTGSNPSVGEQAAMESIEEIKHAVDGAQMVFINCGLGGGTGTGAAPVIAAAAKDAGILTVALVTLPFSAEGKARMKTALRGLSRLKSNADTTIVIPNDKLLAVEELTLDKAFKKVDDLLANATKGILEMVTKAGMVNMDFADLRGVLQDSGYAVISVGESRATNEDQRIASVINATMDSPLMDLDISKAKKALVSISGGSDLTLKEAERVFSAVSSKISDDAMLKWGARIDPKMHKKMLRVTVVMSGVGLADYIQDSLQKADQKIYIDDLGIDRIE